MSEAGEQIESEGTDRDFEGEARQLGWHPLEEFRGKPADWVDARTFVMRGEEQLPVLRENFRKTMTRARRAEDDNADLRQKLNEMGESLTTMRTMMERGQEAGYQRAKAEFEAQMRDAVRNGDEARFDHIQAEMTKLDERHEEITAPPPKQPEQPNKGPKMTPEGQAWMQDNDVWLKADPILFQAAVRAELELRNGDDPLTEAQIWDGVTDMVQQKYPRRFAAATGEPAPTREAPEPQQRRAPTVLSPRTGIPQNQQRKGGIDGIADPEERKVARAAYNSIKRGIPDYTEADYMKVYLNPNADVIPDSIARRNKANGATH